MASTKAYKFDILRSPRVTEKSAMANSMSNCVVFDVHPGASKIEIKDAVEKIFEVQVEKVRTANMLGKLKRVGKNTGLQKNWKKAYVYLRDGDALNIIEGL